ncbi:MAG: AAA family ATPase [Candidatus Scalindua sp.]|nr:AAA family ATPase [Candidatus Scalindua sp.]
MNCLNLFELLKLFEPFKLFEPLKPFELFKLFKLFKPFEPFKLLKRLIFPPACSFSTLTSVSIGGPRQCGKTTFAREIMKVYPYKEERKGIYFNWDDDEDRRRIIGKLWGDPDELVIFDELHKFRRWKSWIKGIYDTSESRCRFLVTGSFRVDVYRRGGDSLMGRYHYWRLHPLN